MSNEEPAEAEAADAEGDADATDAEPGEDVEENAAGDEEEAAGEAEPGDEATDSDAGEAEGIQEGDFVRLAYTARTVEGGTLVDTTDPEVAEEEGVDAEGQTIEPRVVVVGAGHVFPAIEEDLVGKAVGDEGSVTVPAAEAFGEYDPDQVRTVSADRIPEDDRYPGGHVDIDGQHGHVETIIGGRARVDFNHVLAGEDVEYDYEVLEVVDDQLERDRGLMGMYVDIDLEMRVETDEEEQAVYDDEGEEDGTETVEYETLYVEATPQLSMNQQWLFQKSQIAQELIDRTGIDRVVVQEVLDGSGGMLGGMGGMGGLGGAAGGADLEDVDAEELVEDLDVDDVDAEELVEELEAETDLDVEE